MIAAWLVLLIFFAPASTADAADVLEPGAESAVIPTLARVWPTNNQVGLSGFCHGLLFYGLGATDLPSYPSGDLLLQTLTDEQVAIRTFGESPFVRTRNGLRYFLAEDPVFNTRVGETHRDQCLATFAALNLPLNTPIRLKSGAFSVSNLLAESVANFSFDQHEPAWTAMAYAKYLPPQKEWINRFGERTSFSRMTRYLLNLDIKSQSCAGTHILQAVVKIDNADRKHSLLDNETRKQLDSYLVDALLKVVQRQQPDGGWNWQWFDSNSNEIGTMTLENRILVTGHLLEVLNSLDPQRRPPETVFVRGAQLLGRSLNSPEIKAEGSIICPFTHAARTAREVLAIGRGNRSPGAR